ncbi:hypothetical protein Ddye_011517 [Dipteronia dyeriana]|uniref:RING-type E3 ubiquitin transferase n=1 Tax=Dipteronia dyeriana TaxID=168575 RepID=A0AAD9X2P2_9ROSI|nr:hypothetical protein Ddye_011517 [Dipteronia dyeriana]
MEAEATIPTLIIMVVLVYSLFHYLYSTKSKWHLDDHDENNNGSDDDDDDDVDCAVCLSKLVCAGEMFRVLKACKHGFHGHCIDAWLKLHSTCPLCRTNVSSKHQGGHAGLFPFWSNISDLFLTSISKWMDNIMISLDEELTMAVCVNFTSIN